MAHMTETWLEAGIVSRDAAALVDFYKRGFGFETDRVLEFAQGTVHRLVNERAAIKVFQPAELPSELDREVAFSDTAGFSYAALHVDDAKSALDRAVAAGATVISELRSHRPGAQAALLQDPDGNSWELLQED